MNTAFLLMYLAAALATPFEKWITEDVVYIITPQEKIEWSKLRTQEKRDQFIQAFWLRRDPAFKEEHYRRIAYANAHFAAKVPGWKTDRGRIYITYGQPDEIEAYPSGSTRNRPPEEGGGITATYPFEKWRYNHVAGLDTDVLLEFVDTTMTGDYRLIPTPPSLRDHPQVDR